MEIALLIRLRVYSLTIKFSADFQVTSPVLRTAPANGHIQDEAISERTSESHSRGTIALVPRLDMCCAYVAARGFQCLEAEEFAWIRKFLWCYPSAYGTLKGQLCFNCHKKFIWSGKSWNGLLFIMSFLECNISNVCVYACVAFSFLFLDSN